MLFFSLCQFINVIARSHDLETTSTDRAAAARCVIQVEEAFAGIHPPTYQTLTT
jgi:hypothetical protein